MFAGNAESGCVVVALRCSGLFNFDMKLCLADEAGVALVAGIFDWGVNAVLTGDEGSEYTIGTSPTDGTSLTNVPWRLGICGGGAVSSEVLTLGLALGCFESLVTGVDLFSIFLSVTAFFLVSLLAKFGFEKPILTEFNLLAILDLFKMPFVLGTLVRKGEVDFGESRAPFGVTLVTAVCDFDGDFKSPFDILYGEM